jgi:glycosyltransferase involved in cell wall biosynthesis
MRSIIRACGADARVVPNGLPETAFDPVDRRAITRLRACSQSSAQGGFLFKMARWEREKGWTQALDAMVRLHGRDRAPILVARSGGPTGPGAGLAADARLRGLSVTSVASEDEFLSVLGSRASRAGSVIDLRFGVSASLARTLYAAADGVLANSVSEPFGLVGLEAMAAGGVAFTGGTGEDYAVDRRNAVVLETLDPTEIVMRWEELADAPDRSVRLRRAARKAARNYEWSAVVDILLNALARQAWRQGLLGTAARQAIVRQAPREPVELGPWASEAQAAPA